MYRDRDSAGFTHNRMTLVQDQLESDGAFSRTTASAEEPGSSSNGGNGRADLVPCRMPRLQGGAIDHVPLR